MREPVRIGAPIVPVVDLSLLQAHVRDENAESDLLLAVYLGAATEQAERYIGRALTAQQWEMSLDAFPTGDLILPWGPVRTVDEITYLDAQGVATVLAEASYRADLSSVEARLQPVNGWPLTAVQNNAVTIQWTAGDLVCPDDLKVGIMMLAGHLYENREAVATGITATELPLGPKVFFDRHRRFKG